MVFKDRTTHWLGSTSGVCFTPYVYLSPFRNISYINHQQEGGVTKRLATALNLNISR